MKINYSLLCILLSFITIKNVSADLGQGLVAYYPFNGNAKDESGYVHHGSVYGAILTIDRDGNTNSAYKFDGNDYIISDNKDVSFKKNQNFTVSIWVKIPNGCNDSNYCGGILSKMGLTGKIEGYQIGYHNSGVFRFEYYPDNPPSTGTHFHGITNIVDNSWHLISVTVDKENNTIKLYTDSKLENTIIGDWISGATETTNPLYFGMLRGSNYHYTGIIDDLRIYNRALSSSEVLELYEKRNNNFWLPDPETVKYCKNHLKECDIKPQAVIIPL